MFSFTFKIPLGCVMEHASVVTGVKASVIVAVADCEPLLAVTTTSNGDCSMEDVTVAVAPVELMLDLRNAVGRGPVVGGGVADVMMHVPYQKEFGLRNPEAVLFGPYQREGFALARNPMRMTQPMLASLPDEPIGVEIDSIPDFYLLGAFGGRLRERIVHYMTIPEAVDALVKGDVAAVVATQSQVEAALGERAANFPITPVTFPGMMTSNWDIGMAVKENSRDLAYAVGDAVTTMLEDGTMQALFRKHRVTHNAIPVE